jgi:hypothetical protein
VWFYTADGSGGSNQLYWFTNTSGEYITDTVDPTYSAVESWTFYGMTKSSGEYWNVYIDYIRFIKDDYGGWQNDGYNTHGLEAAGGGTITTDETDYISLASDSDGSIFNITFDGSREHGAGLDPNTYQFLELQFHTGDAGDSFALDSWNGSDTVSLRTETVIDSTGLYRFCLDAVENSDTSTHIMITGYSSQTIRIDYIKAYSILNWSITYAGIDGDDSLYVEDGILYNNPVGETESGYYWTLLYDESLSVNTATYNIANVTTNTTRIAHHYYVAAWYLIDYHETRYEMVSGTLTQFKFYWQGADVSHITIFKYIEDSTAPTLLGSWVTPNDPDDSEPVTFTAYTTDTVEVYKVTLNAIIYPAGFSDIDYDLTEETADETWYYTFSTLTNGYYLFEVIASDGANTDNEFLPVSVIEAGISVIPISFIGAGPDFTGVQFSFECNRDGTFSITEWTQDNVTDPTNEAETHTGTVIDGLNNVFWDKLTTSDLTVYFNFTINSGSLQSNWTSTYQIATATFDITLSDKTTDFDFVYIQGEASKAATYEVYIEDVLRDSGSVAVGSFAISFEMQGKRSLTDHEYGIKFTDGTSVDWINGSYYADSPDQYKGGGVTNVLPWWQDPMTWVFIGGGLALVWVFTSGRQEGNIPNAPKGLK